jgi:RimJ/RimL family protein N-acetyltransferase
MPIKHELQTSSISISAQEVVWDTMVMEKPVVQITKIKINDNAQAEIDYVIFEKWIKINNIGLISCRLEHNRLKESIFLESKSFNFIEMVLHPFYLFKNMDIVGNQGLEITLSSEKDRAELIEIAENAFKHERFHIDPRIDPRCGGKRYGRWVSATLGQNSSQRLLKVYEGKHLIAFFIVEQLSNLEIYWHLTAVAPQFQGKGYGQRVWMAMLNAHKLAGFDMLSTTISARNTSVLNLYSKLNFRFKPPEMTFHWVCK